MTGPRPGVASGRHFRHSHHFRRRPPPKAAAVGFTTAAVATAAGMVVDRLLEEPPASVHPVAAFGTAMEALERRLWRDNRLAGAVHAAAGLALSVAAGRLVGSTAAATYLVVAGRSLELAATEVSAALALGRLDRARSLLPALVGRDPDGLDEDGVIRAVVESTAENTVDAVVAPTLWAVWAGAPGAAGYRALNTLDAMVGHRSPRYERYGWASARLDDVAGWAPARVTAALVVLVRPWSAAAVWRAVRQDAPAHPSPNAGVAEAAFAAALGVRLGGVNRYDGRIERRPFLGRGRPPERADIDRAVRLSRHVGCALAVTLVAVAFGVERIARDDGQRRW